MYQKIECVCLVCDNCGETYLDGDTGFSIFVDEDAVHEAADIDGWYLNDTGDGKYYCPDCHSIDDEDNLIVNGIYKTT